MRSGNRKAELYRQHKRAQLCGKWVLKLHHGALSIIHRTHDFFPFLSVHSKTSQAGKKQVRDGSPYLNSHLHSSSCLIFSLFCKFSVTLLCLVLFSFFLSIYPVRLSFSLCLSIVLSLWFFLLMMSLDWSLSDAHKAKHSAGFLPPLMWHWSIEMHTASMVKP